MAVERWQGETLNTQEKQNAIVNPSNQCLMIIISFTGKSKDSRARCRREKAKQFRGYRAMGFSWVTFDVAVRYANRRRFAVS